MLCNSASRKEGRKIRMVSHTRSETRLWYSHAATTGVRVPILSARLGPGRHRATGKVTTSQALLVRWSLDCR